MGSWTRPGEVEPGVGRLTVPTRVVAEDGSPLPPGEVGQVEVALVIVDTPRRAPRIAALVERGELGELWLAGARATLAKRLPPEATPSLWSGVASIPRLPGGKIDLEAVRLHFERAP